MAERAPLTDAPNLNALWASLLLDEFARTGGRHVVIAPGSRSTPLVVAAVTHRDLACHLAIDERAAGFMAVGIARGSGAPAAVITTSGTAVANLLPAVTEADADGVPLLVLTADRPPELRAAGANQAIDQPGIFGSRVRWMVDLPCPTDAMPARVLLTTMDHAIARATGLHPGPVQLNCAFREPLAPTTAPWDRACLAGTDAWRASDQPFTRVVAPAPKLDRQDLGDIADLVRAARHGLVIAGSLVSNADRDAVCALASALRWPLLTAIRSGLRLRADVPNRLVFGDRMLGHVVHAGSSASDTRVAWRPDVVLQFGDRTTSSRLGRALSAAPPKVHVLVAPSAERLDPEHRLTHRIRAHACHVAPALADLVADRDADASPRDTTTAAAPDDADGCQRTASTRSFEEVDQRIRAAVNSALDDDPNALEIRVVHTITRDIPRGHALMISNSLPVRDVDAYGATDADCALVATNRGASGIDGILATGVGVAIGAGVPTSVLIGDLAMQHDLGSLALAATSPEPITIVVINNGGGAIFRFLPIAAQDDVFSPWFDAAHTRRFEGAARDAGLAYACVSDSQAFEAAYRRAGASDRSTLVEVVTDGSHSVSARERLEAALSRARDSRP